MSSQLDNHSVLHNMPFDIVPVDLETYLRVQRSDTPLVAYRCELQEVGCGMFVEGTTSAVSAHLRGHGITGPDTASTSCTWAGCSKILQRRGMTRHILTHLGVKLRCSVCGVVKCRNDLLRAHITSSEQCRFASVDIVPGPQRHFLLPEGWVTAHQVYINDFQYITQYLSRFLTDTV